MGIVNVSNVTDSSSFFTYVTSAFFSQFVVALIILFVGLIVGKIVGRLLHRVLAEIELNAILRKMTRVKNKADEIIATCVSWMIYIITVLMVLEQLGITALVLNSVSLFLILLTLLLIFLSLKDFIPNLVAGIRIQHRRMFRVGEKIILDRVAGSITDMSLLDVTIITRTGDTMIVPSSYILKHKLRIVGQKK